MLETCGCRLLPLIFQRPDCKDIPMLHYASAFSFLRCSRMKVDHIFSRSLTELLLFKNALSFLWCSRMKVDHISSMSPTELLLFENALVLQTMLLNLHHQFPGVVLFFREHPVQLKNFLEFWKERVVFFLYHDSDREKKKPRRTNMDFFAILIIVSLVDPTFLQQKLEQLLFCGNFNLEDCIFTPQQNILFLDLFDTFYELSSAWSIRAIFCGNLNLRYLLRELQKIQLGLYQKVDIRTQDSYALKSESKKRNHNGPPGYSGEFNLDTMEFSRLLKNVGPISMNLFQEQSCRHTIEPILEKLPGIFGLMLSQFQDQNLGDKSS